jgi:hypothetical protein
LINNCIDVTTATAALLPIPCCGSVVAAGKFKVATPDVSALYLFLQLKLSYYRAKDIKVKALALAIVNPAAL